jgi:hypothetical protein
LVPKPRAHLTRYHGVFAPASPERAQRLKRVFAIDIETCRECGGELRVIASIEEPAVIERILEHLRHTAEPVDTAHPSRAPPKGDRLV